MGGERFRVPPTAGVRKIEGGLSVEITRHGKGFRVYGVEVRKTPKGDKVQYRRLPERVQREILAKYGSPYAGF